MKYITFTGTTDYKPTKYVFENDMEFGVETCFVQECIFKKHKEMIDEVYIFRTNHPKCIKNYEMIKEILLNEKEDVQVHFVEYESNDTFDDLMKHVFGILNQNDTAMLDITCTFRHIPLSIVQLLPYAQISKKVKIKHIYYGKFIAGSEDDTVIYDYINYFESSKIIAYLNQFISTIRVPNKKDISIQNQEMNHLIDEMFKVQTCINSSNIMEEIKCLKNIKELCNQLLKSQPMYEYYLKQIIQELNWVDEENVYVCINKLSQYMFKHDYYQHAMTILDKNQTIIFNALLLGNKRLEIKDNMNLATLDKISKKLKLSLENIGVKQVKKHIQRIEDFNELNHQTKIQLLKIFRNQTSNPMDQFRNLRNKIQHGDEAIKRSEFNSDIKKLEKEFDSYLTKLNYVAKLPDVYKTTQFENKGLFAQEAYKTFVKEVNGHYEIC